MYYEPDAELIDWCYGLLEANMKDIYEDDWNGDEKRRELCHEDARIMVARSGGENVGFVHMRFIFEEDVEVLYCYELQLTSAVQRKGLGQRMMKMCELLAMKLNLKGVMLTTFKNNPAATAFYSKLKYENSPISPSWVNPLAASEYSYEIMQKIFCKDASASLLKRAEVCREEWVADGIEEEMDAQISSA